MKPATARVVLPSTRRRDTLLGVGIGLTLLAAVVCGIFALSRPYQSRNILVGIVIAKEFFPQKEEQLSFNGRRSAGRTASDGEYLLQVRVEKEARTYAVPVEKAVYARQAIGAKLEFVRPPSEQHD